MNIIFIVLYLLWVVYFAKLNKKWIENGKVINHPLNGALHIVGALLYSIIFNWMGGVSLLLLTRVVFDHSLNLFRGLSLTYYPKNPTSVIDKYEEKIFKKKLFASLVELTVAITLLILF